MSDSTFFGYGSLVNLNTHSYTAPRPVQVSGWRRVWRSTTHSPYAILSVQRCPDTTLDGIVAAVPDGDWGALDQREAAYVRQNLPDGTAIYEITENILSPAAPHPILRSYLDVVIQGYLHQFGAEPAARFVTTTTGWRAVHDDRNSPVYPRHQVLTLDETAFVDMLLATMMEELHQA